MLLGISMELGFAYRTQHSYVSYVSYAVLGCAVLCCAVLRCAVLCCAVLCCDLLAVQHH